MNILQIRNWNLAPERVTEIEVKRGQHPESFGISFKKPRKLFLKTTLKLYKKACLRWLMGYAE